MMAGRVASAAFIATALRIGGFHSGTINSTPWKRRVPDSSPGERLYMMGCFDLIMICSDAERTPAPAA
jgi:hypothetical protein